MIKHRYSLLMLVCAVIFLFLNASGQKDDVFDTNVSKLSLTGKSARQGRADVSSTWLYLCPSRTPFMWLLLRVDCGRQ